MRLLAYVSDSNITEEHLIDAEIRAIEAVSKIKNVSRGVCGFLLFLEDKFLQVIEGEDDELEKLMRIIEKDKRHSNIVTLVDRPIKERLLGEWNMDCFVLNKRRNLNNVDLKEITRVFEDKLLPSSIALRHFYTALLAENSPDNGITESD